MGALEAASTGAFLRRTSQHLRQWFPLHSRLLDREQMENAIRAGWQKATSYDLTAECCVRSYIELMFLLGHEFDSDVLLPWAGAILKGEPTSEQIQTGDLLHKTAWDYAKGVAADYRNFWEFEPAMLTGESRAAADLVELLPTVREKIGEIFHAKCSFVSSEILLREISSCIRSANRRGITSERGTTLFTLHRFVFGAGFEQSLILPWVSAGLDGSPLTHPHRHIEELHKRVVSFTIEWMC
jgi:hypothetical protein